MSSSNPIGRHRHSEQRQEQISTVVTHALVDYFANEERRLDGLAAMAGYQHEHGALLCHRAGSRDVVDASVVLASIEHLDAPILTDDLGDIGQLVDASGHTRIKIVRP